MPKPVVVVRTPSTIEIEVYRKGVKYIERVFREAGWGCLVVIDNVDNIEFDVISVSDAEIKSFEELKNMVDSALPDLGVRKLDL